ncbi:MAG: GNAT family N-acetyltransferase, partial [Chloracidobacterium sp. CP2_5A]
TVARRERKLRRERAVEIRVVRNAGPELDRAVADFVSVYNSSWKQPEPFPAFIPSLAAAAARAGVLRLGVLRVDDQPAAAQLWITTARRAVIYKLAYDERFKEFSVGSILSAELFRV